MGSRVLADLLVFLHVAFVAFVVLGGFLVLWRPWFVWLHLPAALWGTLIEFTGWVCPLTPWEQHLRRLAGQAGFTGGFIEHYLLPVLYPAGLTASVQVVLGATVVVANLVAYGVVGWIRKRRRAT